MSKPFLFALALVTSLLASSLASAEPRPLSEKRSRPYYWTQGSLAAGGLALGVAATPIIGEHRGHYWGSFYPDDLVDLRFSESAAALSDNLLVTTIALPLLVQMSQGFDTSMANATLIYGQAHALNLPLTAMTKLIARRSRPYTRSHDPRIQEFADNEGSEAHVSFFSGHASSSFTAATAGSILYSARTDELWATGARWFVLPAVVEGGGGLQLTGEL